MNSRPRSAPGASGWSMPRRSWPQFSQRSTPSMLSKAQYGQIIAPAPLLDRPGVALDEQLADVAWTLELDGVFDLLAHQRLVRRPLYRAQHPDRHREVRPAHPAQHERDRRVFARLVVDQQI